MNLVDMLEARIDAELDIQPEQDLPKSNLLFQTVGLFAGCGLILGALPGALVGHFVLEDAFGLGTDSAIWLGALIGAIAVAMLASVLISTLSSRIAATEPSQSFVAH